MGTIEFSITIITHGAFVVVVVVYRNARKLRRARPRSGIDLFLRVLLI